MPKGGPQPGSGRPKGRKNASTLSKEAMREAVRQHVFEHMRPMVAAQIAAAIGLSHFMLRDEETGEFRRVMDPDQIERALNSPGAAEGSTYWIFSKDPRRPRSRT